MNYIRITKENIDKEHICCAMSGKQSVAKKEWLRQRFDDGLVFYRSEERGKCFIEYIPAENAWVPIEADGYLYIDCLWVSGSMKGHGYSNDLLEACIRDAKAQGKKGICILCAEGRKREFLADPKFLAYRCFFDFLFYDVAFSIICFNYDRFCLFLGFIRNLIHFPEDILQKLFLFVGHRCHLLRIIRVVGGLYSVDGKDLRPDCTGA